MDAEALRGADVETLSAWLWRRLRGDAPGEPPLGTRFRQEAPEQVLIDIWRKTRDAAFRDRVAAAMRDSLARLAPTIGRDWRDAVVRDQLASLAFLARGIDARPLASDLFDLALSLWTRHRRDGTEPADALFRLLDAVAALQDGGRLSPFWQEVFADAADPGLRAIAFYGLTRADVEVAMDRLGRVVDDRDLELPLIAWHLATRAPGIDGLSRAASARLTADQRARLRAALVEVGAPGDMLSRFDGAGPFRFRHRPSGTPARPQPAPRWYREAA